MVLLTCSLALLLTSVFVLPAVASAANKPNSSLPAGDWKTLEVAEQAQQTGTVWHELGPEPIVSSGFENQSYSGRVSAIAVNESDPSNIYVGTGGGGVWKTTDGGNNWSPVFDLEPTLSVGAMTISPDGKTLYVGTGDKFVSPVPRETRYSGASGTGLYKTSDGGKSWTQLGGGVFTATTVTSILLFPGNPSMILVSAESGGIYLSEDGGVTWETTNDFPEFYLVSIPSDSSNVFASGFGSLLKSTDGGQTWQSLRDNTTGPTFIAVSPAAPDSLYMAYSSGWNDPVSILRYDVSSGREYTLGEPPSAGDGSGVCGGQCNYDLVLAVDPANSSIMYFGAQDLYVSFDGGAMWKDVGGYRNGPSNIHPDQHVIAFVPGSFDTVIVGNDGGVWESTDGGTDWTDLNEGLGTALLTSIALSPAGVMLGGTLDSGCVEYSRSTSWQAVGDDSASPIGDCVWTGISSNNPGVMYSESNKGVSAFTFLKSVDGGRSWSQSDSGLNMTVTGMFGAPVVAQDPLSYGTIYIGSARIYKTTDFGETWAAVTDQVKANQVTAIAVAPSNDSVIYAGDDQGGVQVSTDAGASWKYVYYLYQTLTYPVTSIAVDPANPLIAYVSYQASIIKTTDGGKTWTHVPVTGLASTCAACLNIEDLVPGPGVLYAGTEAGVYYSSDGGVQWSRLGVGFPNAVVTDIVVTPSTIYAATYGRGAWKVSTAASSFPVTVIQTGEFGFLLTPVASVAAGGVLVAAMLAVDTRTWGTRSRWRWFLGLKWFLPLVAFVPPAIGYFSTVLPSPTQFASNSFSLQIVVFNDMLGLAGSYWYGWIPILVYAGASRSFGRKRVRRVIAMWIVTLLMGFLCFAGTSALFNSAATGGSPLASYGMQFLLNLVFSAMMATLTVPLSLVQAFSGSSELGIVVPVLALILSFIIPRLLVRFGLPGRVRGGGN
jgi:photosystem II stability/assembly factor-like uncharacterized protein